MLDANRLPKAKSSPQVLGTFHGLNAALLGLGPEDLRVWLEQHGLEMKGYKVVPQNG